MNIQDLITVIAKSVNFRNTEIHVVLKKGGTRPIDHVTVQNGHIFLVPDFDANKNQTGVIDP